MFNLGGWGEVLIIAVTALIVLKPEDLPKVMHQLGRWMLSLRRLKYQLQTHYLDALYATEREDVQRQVRENQAREAQERMHPDKELQEIAQPSRQSTTRNSPSSHDAF